MNATVAAGIGVALVLLLLLIRWKWKSEKEVECPPCTPVQLVHRLCPHHNVVQSYPVEEKDSLDDHLDVLTRKLAEKEGRLRLSKSKIRETQHEIDNLHAIDYDVRTKYREMMESLRKDLLGNEKECKKLQEQIEWVSRRRAELRDEHSRAMCKCTNKGYEESSIQDPEGFGYCFVDKIQQITCKCIEIRKQESSGSLKAQVSKSSALGKNRQSRPACKCLDPWDEESSSTEDPQELTSDAPIETKLSQTTTTTKPDKTQENHKTCRNPHLSNQKRDCMSLFDGIPCCTADL